MTETTPKAPLFLMPKLPGEGPCSFVNGVDPDLFWGVGFAVIEAKAICRTCPIPVRAACLEWSLDNDQTAGVWGGRDEEERKTILRRRKNARRDDERAAA